MKSSYVLALLFILSIGQSNELRAESLASVQPRKMLIISHPRFAQSLQGFRAWKAQLGIETFLDSKRSTLFSWRSIKRKIEDVYEHHQIQAVLLVGDAEFVSYHPGTVGNVKGQEADPLYGFVKTYADGPQISVGRWSVKTVNQLETIIAKVIAYERDADVTDSEYQYAMGVASAEGRPADFEKAEELRTLMLAANYQEVARVYDPGANKEHVMQAFDRGLGWINYIGHGQKNSWTTSGFEQDDLKRMNSNKVHPVVIAVACTNGDFSGPGESLGESLIYSGTSRARKGAIAVLASSTRQEWRPPLEAQKQITRLLTAPRKRELYLGDLVLEGFRHILTEDANDLAAQQTVQSWNLFGDPSLSLRSQVPQAILLESIQRRDAVLELHLLEEASDIRFSLSQGAEVLASGYGDSLGKIKIAIPQARLSQKLQLTLSGYNRKVLPVRIP